MTASGLGELRIESDAVMFTATRDFYDVEREAIFNWAWPSVGRVEDGPRRWRSSLWRKEPSSP